MFSFQEVQSLLIQQFQQIDGVQWVVLLFGISEVLLARANNILLYPAGIISTSFAIYGLLSAQLYAESVLHLYYVVMSVYGWWLWSKRENSVPVSITFTSKSEWFITIIISLGGWLLFYFALITFTSSTVPVWDALVSSTAWAGTWLLAKRKVENWIVLNISNAFAIPLLIYKQLPLFALLTIILFIVACWGYVDWKKKVKMSLT